MVDAAAVFVMSNKMTGRLQQVESSSSHILVFFLGFYTYSNRPHHHEAVKSVQRVADIRSIDTN